MTNDDEVQEWLAQKVKFDPSREWVNLYFVGAWIEIMAAAGGSSQPIIVAPLVGTYFPLNIHYSLFFVPH